MDGECEDMDDGFIGKPEDLDDMGSSSSPERELVSGFD